MPHRLLPLLARLAMLIAWLQRLCLNISTTDIASSSKTEEDVGLSKLKANRVDKMGKKQLSSLFFSEIVEGQLLCKVNLSLARHTSTYNENPARTWPRRISLSLINLLP